MIELLLLFFSEIYIGLKIGIAIYFLIYLPGEFLAKKLWDIKDTLEIFIFNINAGLILFSFFSFFFYKFEFNLITAITIYIAILVFPLSIKKIWLLTQKKINLSGINFSQSKAFYSSLLILIWLKLITINPVSHNLFLGDFWYFIAQAQLFNYEKIQNILPYGTGAVNSFYPFNTIILFHAFLIKITSGIAYQVHDTIGSFFIIYNILIIFAISNRIIKNKFSSVTAVLFYLILMFWALSSVAGGLNLYIFASLPKISSILIIVPLTFLGVYLFRKNSREIFTFLNLNAFMFASLHSQNIIWLSLLFLGITIGLLINYKIDQLKILFPSFVSSIIICFLFIFLINYPFLELTTKDLVINQVDDNLIKKYLIEITQSLFIVNPTRFFDTRFLLLDFIFLSTLGTLALFYSRKLPFIVNMIIGCYLSVMIIIFNPWIVGFLSNLLPIFIFERFLWTVPFFLVPISFYYIYIQKRDFKLVNNYPRLFHLSLCVLILIAYIPGEPGEILDKNYREFYHSFYSQVSSGSTVISDAKTSNTLPAIKPVVIFTATKDTAKKGLEKSQSDYIDVLFDPITGLKIFEDEINKISPDYVVIDKLLNPHLSTISLSETYSLIFDNRSHLIFIRVNK
tara:strand:+ start:2274 stop:4148 length:1875 start_codon:yes stop_codon:yes gene_type:complete